MAVADRVFAWRCDRARRVLERQRRRLLEADLAQLGDGRERADLVALLDRYDDDQTAEVREMLGRHPVRAERRTRAAAGFARPRPRW